MANSIALLIFLVNPVNTLPGPTSTNLVAPKSTIVATQSSQSTGAAACFTKAALIAAPSFKISPVIFATTGI